MRRRRARRQTWTKTVDVGEAYRRPIGSRSDAWTVTVEPERTDDGAAPDAGMFVGDLLASRSIDEDVGAADPASRSVIARTPRTSPLRREAGKESSWTNFVSIATREKSRLRVMSGAPMR